MSWVESNPWKTRLLIFAVVGLALEGLVRVLVFAQLLPYEQHPTAPFPTFVDTIDRDVGPWRYPNASLTLYESCASVDYTSNSYGAMDVERSLSGENRVVVLGDSFAAGDWMSAEERFVALLEQRTGLEHMNFALGGTGTIHQWQVYKHKAASFQHDAVMLFVLPFNDFENNRPTQAYHPYLRDQGAGPEIYYPIAFEDIQREELPLSSRIKNTIDNQLYLANVLRWGARVFKDWRRGGDEYARERRDRNIAKEMVADSYYDSFTPEDMVFFKTAVAGIAEEAADKPFYVFLVPYYKDFQAAQARGYDFALVSELNSLKPDHPNLRVIDLLPGFLADAALYSRVYDDYVLGCDLHWNETGHDLAARIVIEALSGDLYDEAPK